MEYIGVITHLLYNRLLTSWDIQVGLSVVFFWFGGMEKIRQFLGKFSVLTVDDHRSENRLVTQKGRDLYRDLYHGISHSPTCLGTLKGSYHLVSILGCPRKLVNG